ncbi:MAG: multiheme c-type cytochrome, partial [Candidatus Latescibacteria bacterium]|nr:multiheme c-type cytochrome [Candidatus Latescibacterota bacterium]
MFKRVSVAISILIILTILGFGGTPIFRHADYWIDSATDESCVGCHVRLHPMMVQEWKNSPHFISSVGCEACHGTDHAKMQSADGKVSAKACGETCHAREYTQFTLSKHSKPKTGRKADLLSLYPDEVGGCTFTIGCHAVRQPYSDGSSGKCSVC